MPKRAPCELTLDLLTWTPPPLPVRRYDERRVARSQSLRVRIAQAIAETLRTCDMDREMVAARMSAWLDEDVSKHMLDAYASPAREGHRISFERLIALVAVTGDVRPLTLAADAAGHIVVDDSLIDWVRVGQAYELKREAEKAVKDARRRVGRGR